MDEKIHVLQHEQINNELQDHETRLRKVEATNVKLEYSLSNIENSQKELKDLVVAQKKDYENALEKFTNKLLDTLTSDIKTDKKMKFYQTKQFWGAIGAAIGIVGTVIVKVIH